MAHRLIRGDGPRRDHGRIPPIELSVDRRLGILFENREWLAPLFAALDRAGVPYDPIDVQGAAFLFDSPDRHPLYLNRVSPSSYLRGHGPALRYAHALLSTLEQRGTRVVNGATSFQLETSKVLQQLQMRALGAETPRTIVFNDRRAVLDLARDFPFPAILKPDTGGSGALIRKIDSHTHLIHVLGTEAELFGPEHLLLLQEFVVSADGAVVRTEFIDGELVFAMRVTPKNTFNLCPADGCQRTRVDTSEAGGNAEVHFELYRDIPEEAVALSRAIVRGAELDVGGVEYIETVDGRRVFYDINATSVYRDDIGNEAGVDGFGKLCGFLARELAKATIGLAGDTAGTGH
jgi:glutathione synthase/RimK-type ligase-like ATP-grasp enzyme